MPTVIMVVDRLGTEHVSRNPGLHVRAEHTMGICAASHPQQPDLPRRLGYPPPPGRSADELAYLQGRNAAADRAWQIEIERWRSEGRLAERVGAAGLGWDRFARRARLDDTARTLLRRLDPATRRWVDGLRGRRQRRAGASPTAPEFAAIGTAPGRGSRGRRSASSSCSTSSSGRSRTSCGGRTSSLLDRTFSIKAASGSNAWAVAGAYIAGDPHRLLELPGVYQQVRLACPEFDVVGFAFPGVPGVPHFGHAGERRLGGHQRDGRLPGPLPRGAAPRRRPDRGRGAAGWTGAAAHREDHGPRRRPEPVEVIETARGPVIDDAGDQPALPRPGRGGPRVQRAAAAAAGSDRRRRRRGLRDWVEPVNSVLVGRHHRGRAAAWSPAGSRSATTVPPDPGAGLGERYRWRRLRADAPPPDHRTR